MRRGIVKSRLNHKLDNNQPMIVVKNDRYRIPRISHTIAYNYYSHNVPLFLGTIDPPQQWHSAKYILSVKERHTLSQCAVDCVVRSTTSLISSITTGILNELRINHDIPENIMQLLQTKFQSAESSLFSGISTAYQQRKYFRKEFNKVVSMHT